MLLRPSSAHRWWHCGLSVSATTRDDALPDIEIDAAREGTCAAWVPECVINHNVPLADMVGKVHENGWTVDDDMTRHLGSIIDAASSRQSPRSEVFRSIDMGDGVILGGTLDLESWQRDGSTLRIDDLKYGYEIVEPFENKQLICYAFLMWCELVNAGKPLPSLVVLSIDQPRAIHPDGSYRKWVTTFDELMPYFAELQTIAKNIADSVAVPGKHCTHCGAAATCQALTQTVYAMHEPIQNRVFLAPTGQQLADELDMLDRMSTLMKARTAAVKAEAEIRIQSQKFVPGWCLDSTQGNRVFNQPLEMVHAMTGVDPYEKKAVTPAELVRRGANQAVVDSLVSRPPRKRQLTRVDVRKIEGMFK